MKKYKPFSVEIDFGLSEAEKDYMSILPNLKFEREGKAAGEVIKSQRCMRMISFRLKYVVDGLYHSRFLMRIMRKINV